MAGRQRGGPAKSRSAAPDVPVLGPAAAGARAAELVARLIAATNGDSPVSPDSIHSPVSPDLVSPDLVSPDLVSPDLVSPDHPPAGSAPAALAFTGELSGGLPTDDLVGQIVMAEQVMAWAKAVQVEAMARLAGLPAPEPQPGRRPQPGSGVGPGEVSQWEDAEAEIAAALVWSRRRASNVLDDVDALTRLPKILGLLRCGLLDVSRVTAVIRTMTDTLQSSSAPDADPAADAARWAAVEARIAARAPGRTSAQLMRDIRRAAITVDPALAERRREKAVKEREVRYGHRPDGMATIEAILPAEGGAIVDMVLTLLADAARDAAARTGTPDSRTHDQRRADALTGIFTAILDGTPLPIYLLPVTAIPAWTPTGHPSTPDWQPGWDGSNYPTSQNPTQNGRPDWNPEHGHGREEDQFGPGGLIPESFIRPDPAPHPWPNPTPSHAPSGTASPEVSGPAAGAEPDAPTASASDTPALTGIPLPSWWDPPSLPRQQRRRPHLVITVHADTLTGRDDLPAELTGYGAITAQAARDLARHAGTADLIRLGQPPTCRPSDTSPPGEPPGGTAGGTAGAAPGPSRGSPPSNSPGAGNNDPPATPPTPPAPAPAPAPTPADTYRPTGQLIREVIAQHQTCRAPGCTRRAEQCDVDHVIPYATSKHTCLCNLIPLCRHDHRLKTFTGWTPTMPASLTTPDALTTPGRPGISGTDWRTVEWTSPTGRHYTVPPPDQPGSAHW